MTDNNDSVQEIKPTYVTTYLINQYLEAGKDISSLFDISEDKQICKNFFSTKEGSSKIELGSGARGRVFLYYDKLLGRVPMPVVIKVSNISPEQEQIKVKNRMEFVTYTTEELKENFPKFSDFHGHKTLISPNVFNEIFIASLLSNYYLTVSPTFMYYKGFFICRDFTNSSIYGNEKGWKGFSIIEQISTTLSDIENKTSRLRPYLTKFPIIKAITFQYLYTIFAMQLKGKFVHFDLHPGNIFFKLLSENDFYLDKPLHSSKSPYLGFTYRSSTFYLPNYNILTKMGDLDFTCKFSDPRIIVNYIASEEYLDPIYQMFPMYLPGYDPLLFIHSLYKTLKDIPMSSQDKKLTIEFFDELLSYIFGIIYEYNNTSNSYYGYVDVVKKFAKINGKITPVFIPDLNSYIESKRLPLDITIPKLKGNWNEIVNIRPLFPNTIMFFDSLLFTPLFSDYLSTPKSYLNVASV